MRLVVENYGDAMISRDRSPAGVPRWVVEWRCGRTQIYSKAWYSIDQVKSFVEAGLAQQVEQSPCKRKVASSILASGTNYEGTK